MDNPGRHAHNDIGKLVPMSFGVPDKQAKEAMKGHELLLALKRKGRPPTEDEVREVMKKLPPETKALLVLNLLIHLSESVLKWREFYTHVAVLCPVQRAPFARTGREHYDEAITNIRRLCKEIREAVALRAAEGWPKWDWERGCPVGGNPEGETFATDALLMDALKGLDFGEF